MMGTFLEVIALVSLAVFVVLVLAFVFGRWR